ncbi:hypothetical protein ACLBWT_01525 [Paenibacillus sp. D51F]
MATRTYRSGQIGKKLLMQLGAALLLAASAGCSGIHYAGEDAGGSRSAAEELDPLAASVRASLYPDSVRASIYGDEDRPRLAAPHAHDRGRDWKKS